LTSIPHGSPVPLEASQGLTPLGNVPQSDRLTPVAAGAGLTPIPSDPLTELFGPPGAAYQGPLGGLPHPAVPGDPFGNSPFVAPTSGAMNPYAAPAGYAASYSAAAAAAAQHAGKPKRTGLPWDRQEESALASTGRIVLFSPREAFYKMHRTGGVGRPMLFCISCTLLAGLCAMGYNVVLQLVLLVINAGDRLAAILPQFLLGFAVGTAFGLAFAALATIAASFVQAGILHVCLLSVGAARHGFETTYRLWCYAIGASSLWAIVPIVGGLIAIGFQISGLIIGCWNAHETTLGRAVSAVLIYLVFGCAVLVGLIVLMANMITQLGRAAA
jgi:hypothetical protein